LLIIIDERSYFFVLNAFIEKRKISRELRFINLMSSFDIELDEVDWFERLEDEMLSLLEYGS
jgi:hypothetical protein